MNIYRSLLISTLLIICFIQTLQQMQACPEGGAFIQNLHSGIVEFAYDDLNQGSINKNYFEPISEGILSKDKRMTVAFSIVTFEGSGRQQYYALMLKEYSLQNENTRLSITMDFQYPNSNMLSVWTKIRISYLIVSENLQKNGYSLVSVYMKEFQLKSSVDAGIIDGDLFNHPNDKSLCGYDGRYWHTDGCINFQAIAIYHCYISGWKFNPMGYIGIRQFGFSVQLVDKKGQVSNDEKQEALDVIFGKDKGAGPRLKIDYFDGQMDKIKISLVMSIIQVNTPTYPIGTFTITYSGMYFFNKTWLQGEQEIQRQKSNNLYHYNLPGIKYFIYGISRFVANKGLPRQASIILSSQIQAQNFIYIEHNFRQPKNQIIFSGDFYYKRIDKICQVENGINTLDKNRISQIKFQNFPSNDTSFLIRSVNQRELADTEYESAIEYLYHPNPETEQTAWVTYTFTNIKIGGSYIFYLSINEIGNDGLADYTGYNFAVYANQYEIYRTMLIGTPGNDKIQGIQKGLNINNDTISVKIYTKIYRQDQNNINFRVNLLVKQIAKVFNPVTQCCNSMCPAQSGLNITSNSIQCIICDNAKGFSLNQKYNTCMCKKGSYYIQETIFPKCLPCQAGLCDMCEPKQPKKCIECIFGAELDTYYRTCKCLQQFIQVENKCLLNVRIGDVCIKYGYCDANVFSGLIYKPGAVKCVDGMFDNGQGACSKCNPQCFTCLNTISCLSCDQNAHRMLQNNICVCKEGYFPFEHENKTQVCLKCASQCQSCIFNSESCTQCDKQSFMQKTMTLKGFFTCECISGYHPDGKRNCIESNCNADRYCATCEQKLCTSCIKSSNRILQLPEHICACKEGYFQNLKGQCQRCKSGCAKCNSSTNCQTCVISATNNKNGSCSCPKGTYFNLNVDTNVGFCRKCLSMCETCTDDKTCLSCPSTYILSPQKKCICPPATFVDQNTLVCKQCVQGCVECSSLKQCTKCKEFYHLEEQYCVRNCRMGYYKTQTSCFKCSQGCIRCQNSLACQECQKEYILYQFRCQKQCPEGTIKMPNQSDCIPCNSPCKTCMYHPSNCVSCQNGKGYLQQIGDQMKCLKQCPLGMFPSNGVCELCNLNCLSCLGDKSNCVQCPQNQFLYKGKCQKQCPGVQYEKTCTNYCPNGYYRLDDKKCSPCSTRCLTCESDPQRCITCRQNWFLQDNQCVQKCQEKEFEMNGRCMKCSESCKTCEGYEQNCTSCFNKFQLKNGKCQEKCLETQYFSEQSIKCLNCPFGCKKCITSSQCIECEQKFNLNQGKCQNSCNYPCQKCLSKNQCQSCVTGFYLMEKQKHCIQFCPKGMRAYNGICKCAYGFYFNGTCQIVCPYRTFGDIFSRSCEICPIQSCVECSTKNICQKCQINFYLSIDQSQCLKENFQIEEKSTCPEGFVQKNNNCIKMCPQQNFDMFSTTVNGSMCVYGPYSSKFETKQINSQMQNPLKCPENKFFENGQCKSRCSIGYFQSQKTQECKKCKQTCLTCSDESICQLCPDGYHLVGNTCMSVKCEGISKFFNGKCMNQCPKGTYFDGKVCQQVCPANHYLYEGFCYTQCPYQSPQKVDFACLSTCLQGYTMKGKECT